jgi:hypothetical protein
MLAGYPGKVQGASLFPEEEATEHSQTFSHTTSPIL